MVTLNSRNSLPLLITQNEPIGLELGVGHGIYSKEIINNFNFKQFYMIDWWNRHSHRVSKYLKLMYYSKTVTNTEVYPLRGTFKEFVPHFNNSFFDFIYIDGFAHTGQEKGETLRDWLPKIKPDGIFAGHDYCDKWPLTKHYVDLVADENNLNVNVIGTNDEYASWYYTKQSK
tara:strand:+ start:1190 stop:1708 length:519 start_codon:yes stop_codon:yes gene_type:complete